VAGGSTNSPNRSAIDHRVAFWKVVAGVLLATVLWLVDPLELFSFSSAPICYPVHDSNGIELAGARGPQDAFADQDPSRLFGLDTESVTQGSLLEKWLRIEADITKDLEVVAQCKASNSCPAPAQKLIDLSRQGASRSGRARVGLINRAVDLSIRPTSDETQWGVSDRWSDPFETLQSSLGDCEDYAIVKYAALRAAGFQRDAVKLVVLRNHFPSEDHAVAAAWVDNEWLILDNRTLTLVRDTDVTRAIPRFVLDDQGLRRFVENRRNPERANAVAPPAIARRLWLDRLGNREISALPVSHQGYDQGA
jgi:predicted transglutaminase-like cysteine proteinase